MYFWVLYLTGLLFPFAKVPSISFARNLGNVHGIDQPAVALSAYSPNAICCMIRCPDVAASLGIHLILYLSRPLDPPASMGRIKSKHSNERFEKV